MKRLVPLAVSFTILTFLWWRVDFRAIMNAAAAADPLWLAAGIFAVGPLTAGSAWRFCMLSRTRIGLGVAMRLILSSATLNLFLPSKMGDLAKAWVLDRKLGFDPQLAVALVLLEKLLDLASLLAWGVFALLWMQPAGLVYQGAAAVVGLALLLVCGLMSPWGAALWVPARLRSFFDQWRQLLHWFWSDISRALSTISLSLALWAGHLVQFWIFAQALGQVSLIGNMAAGTLSILAGLLPFTVAGIGTRDAAILFFYRPWLGPGACAMLGVLATLRYVLPALAGIPFMSDYWHRRPASEEA